MRLQNRENGINQILDRCEILEVQSQMLVVVRWDVTVAILIFLEALFLLTCAQGGLSPMEGLLGATSMDQNSGAIQLAMGPQLMQAVEWCIASGRCHEPFGRDLGTSMQCKQTRLIKGL